MKILEIRWKNLNSLYGEWEIDLKHREYISEGIFALTGPTGSGKSTILDAICLALYGQTPRLGRLSASSNEIMSKQTAECYAEVCFETTAGRYRCRWSQHRAHKKADNNLVEAKHEVSNEDNGNLLENKKREVLQLVEEKTGMDFDRFTRSMLLAQGGFDTFLKARSEDKASILEQITGTAIYSDISKQVHLHRREESDRLKDLESSLENIESLSKEQEDALRTDLKDKQDTHAYVQDHLKEIEEGLYHLESLQSLEEEKVKLEQQEEEFEQREKGFAHQLNTLRAAQSAEPLREPLRELDRLNRELIAEKKRQLDIQKVIPELEKKRESIEALEKQARDGLEEEEKKREEEKPLLREIRALDAHIVMEQKQLKALTEKLRELDARIAKKGGELKQLEAKEQHAADTIEGLQDQLKEHHLAGEILPLLPIIEDDLNRREELLAQQKESSNYIEELFQQGNEAEEKRQEAEKALSLIEQDLAERQKERSTLQSQQEQLLNGHSLGEYRRDNERLNELLQRERLIASFEEHRANLHDGAPCPLCGSIEHPYVLEHIVQIDEREKEMGKNRTIIEAVEKLDEKIEQIDKEEARQSEQRSRLEKTLNEQHSLCQKLKTQLEYEEKRFQERGQQLEQLSSSLSQRLEAYKLSPETHESKTIITELKAKSTQYADIGRKLETERESSRRYNEIRIQTEEALSGSNKEREALCEDTENLKKRIQAKETDRCSRFGRKDPDTIERAREEAIEKKGIEASRSRSELLEAQRLLENKQIEEKGVQERTSKLQESRHRAEEELLGRIGLSNFEDEQELRDALLDPAELEVLEKQAAALETERTELLTRRRETERRILQEKEKIDPDADIEEYRQKKRETEEQLSETAKEVTLLSFRLEENETQKSKHCEALQNLETQKKQYEQWEILHRLIGSSDGKAYRTFAQGITFELMVSHANRQLNKMSDRYLLRRNPKDPLDLEVMDNYQAGEIRSTRNLSGGESFIVSLSLALGLSGMASRNVKVDSLFLDEGFGTLDDEALETALETLSGLKEEDKLIGIISHVPALKERIGCQISVISQSGGKSRIEGPGCKRIT